MKNKIGNILIKLGITPDLNGFNYIIAALELLKTNENMPITTLYGLVAKQYNTHAIRVERCMRHAFRKMDRKSDAYKKYIGINNPTNGSVLHTLEFRLKEIENETTTQES